MAETKNDIEVEETLDLPEVKEGEEDTTDWKAEATKLREKAIRQRERTKILKEQLKANTPKAEAKAEPEKKSGELGYSELAYLRADGIKDKAEIALVKEVMEDTGKSLQDVIDSKYFQSALKEHRDAKASADAVPKGTKRSGQSASDSVDYWIAKGENPPNTPENTQLRRDVVAARMKAQAESSPFAPSSKLIIK